jgi:hypothetical protein
MLNNNKKYNGGNWKFDLYIYNSDVVQEFFQSDESSSLNPSSFVPSKNILYFAIENSINEFYPKATFKITDPNFGITNKIRRQNTLLKVKLERSLDEGAEEIADQKIDLTFLGKISSLYFSD